MATRYIDRSVGAARAHTGSHAGIGVEEADGKLYYNPDGTRVAVPTEAAVTAEIAAAIAPLAPLVGTARTAFFTYDPSANEGERTVAAHPVGPTIPAGAVITQVAWQVATPFGSAEDTAVVWATLGAQEINDETVDHVTYQAHFPDYDNNWIIKGPSLYDPVGLSVASRVTFTVSEQALTAGKLSGWVTYTLPV